MRICKVFVVLAAVGLAAPALAVQVQWSDFETFRNNAIGTGQVGENVENAGYGPPAEWHQETGIKTTNTSSQRFDVPGAACFNTDPTVDGWMIADDGGGAFDSTDWRDFIINTVGGPAPEANSPCTFITDVRIDVDNVGDYDQIQFTALHNAPGGTNYVFEPLVNPDHDFGVWEQDFVFLTTAFDENGELDFILILEHYCSITNPFAGDARFYLDNLRIEYTPEPATLVLFGLSGLALLRRRR